MSNDVREEFAEGREHITVTGKFQSDKYGWCPAGFVPLKLTDPDARVVLLEYARMHKHRDSEFTRDLLEAIAKAVKKSEINS